MRRGYVYNVHERIVLESDVLGKAVVMYLTRRGPVSQTMYVRIRDVSGDDVRVWLMSHVGTKPHDTVVLRSRDRMFWNVLEV